MYPCIHMAGRYFASYHACLLLAFSLCGGLLLLANRNAHPSLRIGFGGILAMAAGAMLGAKCMHLLAEGAHGPLYETLFLWRGGYYFHGGLAGGMAAFALYLRARRERVLAGMDAMAPYVALGESITRIGCFLSGCCWGAPTQGVLGVVFPPGSPAYRQHLDYGWIADGAGGSLPLQPVQLYMSLAMAAVFLLLRRRRNARAFDGEILLHYLVAQSVVRFALDFVRGDLSRGVLGLTLTQWVALGIYGAALTFLMLSYGWGTRRVANVAAAQQEKAGA